MFRALLFLIKVGVLVAVAVWIADRPGTVNIQWLDYTFTLQVGFFLLIALGAMLMGIFIYRVLQTFTGLPASLRRYSELKRQDKGYRALTLGLAAVAAGDKKAAAYQSHRASECLKDTGGLPLLLQAQAERLQGHEEDAAKTFTALSQDKEAGFLGVRGLLQTALDKKDYPKALDLGRQALRMYPRQPWILKLVYDLEIRQRAWDAALKTLYRAEKALALTPQKALKDRVAILIAQAQDYLTQGFQDKAQHELERAVKYDPEFVPAVLHLARLYKMEGKRSKAIRIIERAWKKNPHPDLAVLWEGLLPPQKAGKPMARLIWVETLPSLNPQSAESHLAAGRVAAEEGLWGEAREHFKKAEALEPSARLYRLWANLERRTGANLRTLEMLQEKEHEFSHERRWVCGETGRIYDEWQPVAQPHGSFNTIEWDFPGAGTALGDHAQPLLLSSVLS